MRPHPWSLGRRARMKLPMRRWLALPLCSVLMLASCGRTAATIKETVCKGTVWGIRREAAKPGSYFWLKGGKRPAQLPDDQQVAVR